MSHSLANTPGQVTYEPSASFAETLLATYGHGTSGDYPLFGLSHGYKEMLAISNTGSVMPTVAEYVYPERKRKLVHRQKRNLVTPDPL